MSARVEELERAVLAALRRLKEFPLTVPELQSRREQAVSALVTDASEILVQALTGAKTVSLQQTQGGPAESPETEGFNDRPAVSKATAEDVELLSEGIASGGLGPTDEEAASVARFRTGRRRSRR